MIPIIALLAAFVLAPAASAQFPLALDEPRSGTAVEVRPGARALHLVFFATWCPACTAELERLAEFEARWREHGYRLILIAVATRHDPSKLIRFAEQNAVPGELLFDSHGLAEKALGGGKLPTHLVLDGQGSEVLRGAGFDARVERALENLLARRRSEHDGSGS